MVGYLSHFCESANHFSDSPVLSNAIRRSLELVNETPLGGA